MSFPLSVRHDAERDLSEAAAWYEEQRSNLGDEFLEAADEFFGRIKDTPEIYAESYRHVRRGKLSRFPYVVYYRFREQLVEVIGVIHGSRRPKVWRARAKGQD